MAKQICCDECLNTFEKGYKSYFKYPDGKIVCEDCIESEDLNRSGDKL